MTQPVDSQAGRAAPAVPRRASTLVLLRDGEQGMEVLLPRRAERAEDRSSGAFVFPGGTLDPADSGWQGPQTGLEAGEACARLGLEAGGLDYYVAAIRECLEEAGVLLAEHVDGRPWWPDAQFQTLLHTHRGQGVTGLRELCERFRLRLAAERLAYHGHWLTPPGLPKRFDTRFFVALMPSGQTVVPDGVETMEHRWMRPQEALDRAETLRLPHPTRRTLASMAGFASAAECVAHAHAQPLVRLVMPRMAGGPQGLRPVHPDEPAYAEIARLDPQGTGQACYALEPGRPVRLSARVWRVTAGNAGMMTGPGTNTYLVAAGEGQACAVIDPGPADRDHVQAVLAAAPGPIRWILVTHTHRDHSPGARLLRACTDAQLLGMPAPHAEGQDGDFVPERTLRHGELLPLGPEATLRVLHTPGHASNHLCYLLQEEKTLFTGDHVMQGSTVVVGPPDGDMGCYLASLEALLEEDLDWLAPGHGFLIAEPRATLGRLIRHRRTREAKVLRVLAETGGGEIGELLARVYDDVSPALHPVAQRSLKAHLLLLQAQGRVVLQQARWSLPA